MRAGARRARFRKPRLREADFVLHRALAKIEGGRQAHSGHAQTRAHTKRRSGTCTLWATQLCWARAMRGAAAKQPQRAGGLSHLSCACSHERVETWRRWNFSSMPIQWSSSLLGLTGRTFHSVSRINLSVQRRAAPRLCVSPAAGHLSRKPRSAPRARVGERRGGGALVVLQLLRRCQVQAYGAPTRGIEALRGRGRGSF